MKVLDNQETKAVTGASIEAVNTFLQVLELAKAINSKDYATIINENFPDFIEYFIENKDLIGQKLSMQL